MRISVAMATYMGSAYIAEQLTSVLAQSTPAAEIVICDDCSSDATARIITEFARDSAVPIKLFVNDERLGWRGNFMKAASLCESELIAFCDQDDVWDRRKLETVVAGFELADTLMVFHDATIVGPDLRPIGPFLQGDGEPDRAAALERGPWRDVYGLTVAFRSELLALWRYWPSSADKSVDHQRAAHDQWLLFLGSSLGTTLHLPESLVLYRQHGGNAVSAKDALRRPSRMDALLQHRDVLSLRLVVLDSRIRILGDIAGHAGGFSAAAASALAVYESYRTRAAAQAVVYNSDDRLARLRSFATLLSRRSYSNGLWALGRPTALDDGVAALLGPAGLAWIRRTRSGGSIPRGRPSSRRRRVRASGERRDGD